VKVSDAVKHAVLLAAGEGSRLRPLTERIPKPLLPIDGRPVIVTLMEQLIANGVDHFTVVVGHGRDVLTNALPELAPADATIDFVVQEPRLGSAHALQHATAAGVSQTSLVAASDTVWRDEDITALFTTYADTSPMVAMGLRRWPLEQLPNRSQAHAEDDLRITHVMEKPQTPEATADGTGFAGSPIYIFRHDFWSYVDAIQELSGVYELAYGLEAAIADGHLIQGVEMHETRDITTPDDLLRFNFPYLAPLLR
jgi:bifunctional UDP-N-acetylglucosamine pyrophosphorylase/glucosamine-1-phosphate N-acetyltransferase